MSGRQWATALGITAVFASGCALGYSLALQYVRHADQSSNKLQLPASLPSTTDVKTTPPVDDAAAPASGDMSTAEHAFCRHALAAERAGRTRAEKQLRDAANASVRGPRSGYPALPIGVVESPFVNRCGTPRQGMLAPSARAHIVLAPAIPAAAVDGLSEYSHVYVLFLFHENTSGHKALRGPQHERKAEAGDAAAAPPTDADGSADGAGAAYGVDNDALQERGFQARVAAPALKGKKTGVFATRSPHRPNVIGLSLCRLIEVRTDGPRRVLVLSGADLVSGTPILDIKPYAPFDCPTCIGQWLCGPADAREHATPLQAAAAAAPVTVAAPFTAPRDLPSAEKVVHACADFPRPAFHTTGPDWVLSTLRDQAAARLPVVWAAGTVEVVQEAVQSGKCRYYGRKGKQGAVDSKVEAEVSEMLSAISQALALDIRAVYQGRGAAPVTRIGAGSTGTPAAGLDDDGQPLQSDDPPPEGNGALQWYEMFFDTLHIRFTFRARAAANPNRAAAAEGAPSPSPTNTNTGTNSFARIERVELASARRLAKEQKEAEAR